MLFFILFLIASSDGFEYKLKDRWYDSKDDPSIPYNEISSIEMYKINNSETHYSCKNIGSAYSWIALWQKSCGDFRKYEFRCNEDDYNGWYCDFDGSGGMEIIMFKNYELFSNNKSEIFVEMDTMSFEYRYLPISLWLLVFVILCIKLFSILPELIFYCCIKNNKVIENSNIYNNYYIFSFWIFLNILEFVFYYLATLCLILIFGDMVDVGLGIGSTFFAFVMLLSLPLRYFLIKYFDKIIFTKNKYYRNIEEGTIN